MQRVDAALGRLGRQWPGLPYLGLGAYHAWIWLCYCSPLLAEGEAGPEQGSTVLSVYLVSTLTLSAALLPTRTATLVLGIVWAGAAIGTATNLLWMSAPRWFTTALYIILGWVAIWFLPQFWRTGGPAIVWLLVAGGVTYTLGAVVYARKTPDPSPRWFGFHEIFHVCTVAAWACQCVACFLAVVR